MIVHTLKMCTSYFVHISWYFLIFELLNLDIFPFKMLRWCLVCVICNSNNFDSFIFKLCIVVVHTLEMGTGHAGLEQSLVLLLKVLVKFIIFLQSIYLPLHLKLRGGRKVVFRYIPGAKGY